MQCETQSSGHEMARYHPCSCVCTFCDRLFYVPLTALKRVADAQESLRVQFTEHKCKTRLAAKNKPERNEVRYFLYHEFSRLQHYFLITPFPSGAKHSNTAMARCVHMSVDSEAGTCRGGNEPCERTERSGELCNSCNEQDAKN